MWILGDTVVIKHITGSIIDIILIFTSFDFEGKEIMEVQNLQISSSHFQMVRQRVLLRGLFSF